MDRKCKNVLKSATLLMGALFLGWAAQAQTTNTNPSDSTHHQGMHHGWGHRPGGDSLANTDGYHHGFRNDSTHRGGWNNDHHEWNNAHQGWNKDQAWNNGHDGWKGEGGHDGWASRRRDHEGFGERGERGFADRGRGRHHHGEGIRYTPEQRKQLMAINKEYRQKSEDLYKQDNLTLKQYKAGLIALQKDKTAKTTALLTPHQKDQIATRRKRMDENRQVMQAAHLERLKLRLNLTDDQVAKIKAGQENLHNQVKAIHENSDLLPQQKRDQMKALLAKRNDTYKTVLTPEQYSQFEKMHQHGGFGHHGAPNGAPNAI